jgi:hypothetical protein
MAFTCAGGVHGGGGGHGAHTSLAIGSLTANRQPTLRTCSCTRLALSRPTTSSPSNTAGASAAAAQLTLLPPPPLLLLLGPACSDAASTYRQLTQGCAGGSAFSTSGASGPAAGGGRLPVQDQLPGTCQQPSWLYHPSARLPA